VTISDKGLSRSYLMFFCSTLNVLRSIMSLNRCFSILSMLAYSSISEILELRAVYWLEWLCLAASLIRVSIWNLGSLNCSTSLSWFIVTNIWFGIISNWSEPICLECISGVTSSSSLDLCIPEGYLSNDVSLFFVELWTPLFFLENTQVLAELCTSPSPEVTSLYNF